MPTPTKRPGTHRYSLVDYKRFVGSLRLTGFNGHIILGALQPRAVPCSTMQNRAVPHSSVAASALTKPRRIAPTPEPTQLPVDTLRAGWCSGIGPNRHGVPLSTGCGFSILCLPQLTAVARQAYRIL